MSEHLLLKWGTIKGWSFESEATLAAARRYSEAGKVSASAMSQHDTFEQKQALCDIIDALDGPIQNDWSGEMMTKEEAKNYVLTYGVTQSRPQSPDDGASSASTKANSGTNQ